MADLPARNKAPHNRSVLDRWLTETASHTGVAAGRLRRWLSFMIVAAMLDTSRHTQDGEPLFLIKGGVAVELRAPGMARATQDLDATYLADPTELATHLDASLRAGHRDFTATRTELEPIGDTGAWRCQIKLAYRSRSFSTVKLEIAPTEPLHVEIDYLPAQSFDHLGLTGPDTVPCLALRWQIAQKLHACTEVLDDRDNDRFRDVLDLQLLSDLITPEDLPAVREACTQVFTHRNQHTWPPNLTIYPGWPSGYEALANSTGIGSADVHLAAQTIGDLVNRIDEAR